MDAEIETEKWRIIPKRATNSPLDESYIELIFRLKSDTRGTSMIKTEDLEELEKDLKDLGKWRKFRELKGDLEGA